MIHIQFFLQFMQFFTGIRKLETLFKTHAVPRMTGRKVPPMVIGKASVCANTAPIINQKNDRR